MSSKILGQIGAEFYANENFTDESNFVTLSEQNILYFLSGFMLYVVHIKKLCGFSILVFFAFMAAVMENTEIRREPARFDE